MARIIVRHIDGSQPPQFQVVRQSDGKTVSSLEVTSPVGFPVEGMPQSDLMQELRWYLEKFLEYPFHPDTDRANRVKAALESWGKQAFDALFGKKESARLLDEAIHAKYAELHLEISSDDPQILHWPWEALQDPQAGVLSRLCRISRKLNEVLDPHPLSDKLPKDAVNILLVTARPYQVDVHFRSISRPLVDLITSQKFPATVTLLRPPTIDQLRAHLTAHPDHYHILHFDGHGAYGARPIEGTPNAWTMQGPQGELIFEDATGNPDPQPARVLSELLREYNVPVVVLNACQSAMVDKAADDAFASVAASLQKSGVRSVVAMAYSLYVSAAQQFLPPFYQRLFESGSVAEATRVGRQQLLTHPQRVCSRGTFPLDDSIVPVLYEQQAVELQFSAAAPTSSPGEKIPLPEEALLSQNPYGFIGRDGAVLELERAFQRPPAGILIHGLGGIGKTTLCRGFLKWLADTGGLPHGCFWLSFQEIRSAEYVINQLVGALFGTNALAESIENKLQALLKVLRENLFVIVWDNFEVVRGSLEDSTQGTLSESDQKLLAKFLQGLRGGKTKVLITSRSNEEWLDQTTCFRLRIRGLEGEERWEFCNAVVQDLGLNVDRTNAEWQKLINELDGHPLAMRVVLSRLQTDSPAQLLQKLNQNLLQFSGHDPESARLFATLKFVEEGISPELQRWLIPLSLHEKFVDIDYLKAMGKRLPEPIVNADQEVDRLISLLLPAGLVTEIGDGMLEMHPALSRFLQQQLVSRFPRELIDLWRRSFVDFMGSLADHFTRKELHEQRGVFHIHGTNFRRALRFAGELEMQQDLAALTQSLAAYAHNTRNFQEARELFLSLAELSRKAGNPNSEAPAYHQLGRIAEEQRDFATAEQWYRKSLAIKEQQGNEHGAALTYHQLGRIAEEQRDFATAEQWYRKSLANFEKQGSDHGSATTYHQLGMIAEKQRDFATAEQWYRKSLAIEEKQGNEDGAATTYHQLGMIAEKQLDFATAKQWYRKSLTITEKQGNEHRAALTYHQLGSLAEKQRDFVAAEHWYRKSLDIKEKQGNEYGAATTYHQLGIISQEQRDFAMAEQWYRKSLAIEENLGNEHGAAITYHQLGVIAQEEGDFATAEHWYRKSLAIKEKQGDEHGAARTYNQLGIIAEEQRDFAMAGQWYRKSLEIVQRDGDLLASALASYSIARVCIIENRFLEAGHYCISQIRAVRSTNEDLVIAGVRLFLQAYQAAPSDEQHELIALWRKSSLGKLPETIAADLQ